MEWTSRRCLFAYFLVDFGGFADVSAAIHVGERMPFHGRSRPSAEYPIGRKEPITGLVYYVRPRFDRSEANVIKTEKQFLESRFRDFELYCSVDIQKEKSVGLRMGDDV